MRTSGRLLILTMLILLGTALAHLGIMVQDLESALAEAQKWDVKALPQGRNWLQLPDGLAIELIQAHGNSVDHALAVKPRA